MNTPRGRLNYRYNLVQIANATIETLCYGVIVALFGCSPMSFLSSQAMSSISNDQQRCVRVRPLHFGSLTEHAHTDGPCSKKRSTSGAASTSAKAP